MTRVRLKEFRIVGGQHFTDTRKHPNVRVWIPRYQVWSTAAVLVY